MNYKDLRNQLPHGAIREIAKRADVTESLISRFFNGKIGKSPKETKILNITVQYLKEIKEQRRAAKKELQKVLSEEL